MPLPMVHLLLARTIEEKLGIKNSKYFLLGSIAPDSIHKRAGSNRTDKHKTHMFFNGYGNEEAIRLNKESVINTVMGFRGYDKDYRDFINGYCIHTVLDIIWINKIFNVLAATLRSGGINFNDIRTKYYQETNICDSAIYNSGSWTREYKEMLRTAGPLGFKDILTKDEVGSWKNEIIRKMDGYENEKKKYPPEAAHYITYKIIIKFINEFLDEVLPDYIDLKSD